MGNLRGALATEQLSVPTMGVIQVVGYEQLTASTRTLLTGVALTTYCPKHLNLKAEDYVCTKVDMKCVDNGKL